ncbi:glycosyltransferase [Microbacterium sp. AK009]|uniref:glycosyltransferase family protein n=1 Tax=Microbacterium sp. AK009 TaxID=2723068 RepID=UPI001C5481FD|nr:glycosyltransferase [Microbacterium sp. AK009]
MAGPGAVTRAFPREETVAPYRTLLTASAVSAEGLLAPIGVGGDSDISEVLAASSLRFAGWSDEGPVLTRPPRQARLADGTSVACLRWAIKIAAPAGHEGLAWGDTHFANGLAEALRRLGQEVVIDAFAARNRATSAIDDVSLVLRGPRRIDPPAHGRSLLWIISHPDEITSDELSKYDRIFAASIPWAARAGARLGHSITPLLQCTDAVLFRPQGIPRGKDIVFVGTARGIARPSVVAPIEAGVDVTVYGPDWRRFIPGRFIRASGISHSDLPARYESAAVVLNDHWPAMQKEGFISNRAYDVVAAGGRVISDTVEGLQEHFGGAVRTYDSTSELIGMLRGDLDDLFPSYEKLDAVSRRVRMEDSFDARAQVLLDAAIGTLAR